MWQNDWNGLKLYSTHRNTINDNKDGIELIESNYNAILNNPLISNANFIVATSSLEQCVENNDLDVIALDRIQYSLELLKKLQSLLNQ